jgi:hypothetical protein
MGLDLLMAAGHYGFVDNYRNGIPKTNFDASRCA